MFRLFLCYVLLKFGITANNPELYILCIYIIRYEFRMPPCFCGDKIVHCKQKNKNRVTMTVETTVATAHTHSENGDNKNDNDNNVIQFSYKCLTLYSLNIAKVVIFPLSLCLFVIYELWSLRN